MRSALESITLRPKVDFFGVKSSLSSNASAASPEMISPGPNDNLEDAVFFLLLVEADRPMKGRDATLYPSLLVASSAAAVWEVCSNGPLSSCWSSSSTMLFRREDFLNVLRPSLDGISDISIQLGQL